MEGLAELRELWKSAKTPAEKVAATDAWLAAHPPATSARIGDIPNFEARMAALADRQTAPSVPANERAARSAEIRRVWNETRSAAKNPGEVVALTDEFLRLNAAALSETRPRMPSAEERRARLLERNAMHPAKPDDLNGEIARTLCEIRAEARTPAETVALTDEFLRLNASALAEARSASRKSNPNTPRSSR